MWMAVLMNIGRDLRFIMRPNIIQIMYIQSVQLVLRVDITIQIVQAKVSLCYCQCSYYQYEFGRDVLADVSPINMENLCITKF